MFDQKSENIFCVNCSNLQRRQQDENESVIGYIQLIQDF